MKTLLTLLFVLIATVGFSQKKSDTLIVDFSKYKYIKIGDRVYKIESPTLSEIKENTPFLIGGWGKVTTDSSKLYLPNYLMSMPLESNSNVMKAGPYIGIPFKL